jgi:hypothetical protein
MVRVIALGHGNLSGAGYQLNDSVYSLGFGSILLAAGSTLAACPLLLQHVWRDLLAPVNRLRMSAAASACRRVLAFEGLLRDWLASR